MLSANLAVLVTHLPCCTPHRSQPYPAFRRCCSLSFAAPTIHCRSLLLSTAHPSWMLLYGVRNHLLLLSIIRRRSLLLSAVHSGGMLLFIISCHSALLSTILCRWLLLSPAYRLALLPAPSGHTTRPEKTTHMHASAHNGGRRHPAYHRH